MVVVIMGIEKVFHVAQAALIKGLLQIFAERIGAAVHHHAFALAGQQHGVSLVHIKNRPLQGVLHIPVLRGLLG